MMFPKITKFSGALAAAIMFTVSIVAPAFAQVAPTVLQTATSPDGFLTLTLSSSNASDAVDVDDTYTWTATNTSKNTSTPHTLTGVILGSHWGDYCIGFNLSSATCGVAPPQGPTLISLGPGCGSQPATIFTAPFALFGIWCTPDQGVTLLPDESVSGSVTFRPTTGGPGYYTVYSGYNDPITGTQHFGIPVINNNNLVAPAATDIQISGAASTGSPSIGSTFTYTYQIKNAGPWGTYGGIIFADTLPAPLTYVSSSVVEAALGSGTSAGQVFETTYTDKCSAVGQTVVCTLQDMTVGGQWNQATVTLTVAVSGSSLQQIANTASVHTNANVAQGDSNLANNSVTVNVTTK